MKDVYETSKLTVRVFLRRGVLPSEELTFIFLQDGEEFLSKPGVLKNAESGKRESVASCEIELPVVADDKDSYLLEFKVKTSLEEMNGNAQFKVWPRKGKLKVLNDADDSPFKGFQFKVVQNGSSGEAVYTTADDGTADYKLAKGAGFSIESVDPPYIIKSQTAPKKRELELKGELSYEAVLILPIQGDVKQYVNLDSVGNGEDGNGAEVTIKVGVKGDADGTNNPKIGQAGIFVWVKVKYSGFNNKKSKRNIPKTEITAGLDASDITATTEGVEYEAKVDLKGPDGTGEFKVHLGFAGGDTCTVEVGGRKGRTDETLKFTNWRKLYYEIVAPDFMNLPPKNVPGGATVKDLPAPMTAQSTLLSATTFTEFIVDKTHTFAKDKAPTGTCLPRSFLGRAAGPADVYILTDYTFAIDPQGVAFDRGKAPRMVPLRLCDDNLFAERSDHLAPVTLVPVVDKQALDVPLGRGKYWLPKSGFDGSNTVRSVSWKADIPVPANYIKKAALVTAYDAGLVVSGDDKIRAYEVVETLQNSTLRVKFKQGRIGHIPSSISTSEKARLSVWFQGLVGDKPLLRKQGLNIKIKGERTAGRKKTRSDNIKAELDSLHQSMTPDVPVHPGLDDAGAIREGVLEVGPDNADSVLDITRSTRNKIALNLPNTDSHDPGSFVGAALTDDKCKIKLKLKYTRHYGGLGLASRGEILTVVNQSHPKSSVGIVIHELGHLLKLSADGLAADAVAPGLPKRKGVSENLGIAEYKENGDKGHGYGGPVEGNKGHSGPHCAWGLSDADKAGQAMYDRAAGNKRCIMFGSTTFNDAVNGLREFCPECLDYIRARDASSL